MHQSGSESMKYWVYTLQTLKGTSTESIHIIKTFSLCSSLHIKQSSFCTLRSSISLGFKDWAQSEVRCITVKSSEIGKEALMLWSFKYREKKERKKGDTFKTFKSLSPVFSSRHSKPYLFSQKIFEELWHRLLLVGHFYNVSSL